ncbi:RNA pseudouridylate synthase domain containing protein 2 [Coemansia javaensis]|uniref:Pseudouridine synthase n=1 Tax=Coemansia javaensis TaxID=2761396 RepID=A0A9W8HA83_9FUNG|nr:RNA pseudouridylate synthase domain containing protein 2 [Coemansia javaensis]
MVQDRKRGAPGSGEAAERCDGGERPHKGARTSEKPAPAAADVYYESDGLQRVRPYYHKFATHAKGRWVGRPLLDVLTHEFRDRTAEYYEAAIDRGLIELNGQRAGRATVVRDNDLLTHHVHRHEPPVSARGLAVVRETDDGVLVVDKPASIPVHPTGRYNYNTVTQMLRLQHGYERVFPANRLDRLTSGLLLVGLNADVARRLERNLREHAIQKEYVCRVVGDFPRAHVVCDEPIRVVAHKLGLNCVDREAGKPSLTEFDWLCGDGEHSIVYCRPRTGRTHQIRVHLQFLGHPIANDPLYNNPEVWGPQAGKGGALPDMPQPSGNSADTTTTHDAPAIAASVDAQTETTPLPPPPSRPRKMVGARDDDKRNDAWRHLVERMADWKDRQNLAEHACAAAAAAASATAAAAAEEGSGSAECAVCAAPAMPDPAPSDLCIWLHAWRYSGPGWSHETPLPGWAQDAAAHIDRVKYHAPE